MAETWEVSEDGLTCTCHIKQGIQFHNGDEMTASDVAFSMNRLLAIGEGYAYLFEDSVELAEATDGYTVVFHMKKTFGPFVSALIRLFILNEEQVMANAESEGAYGEFGDYGRNWPVTNDAGSGAYMAKDLVQQDYFLAEKFDKGYIVKIEGEGTDAAEYAAWLNSGGQPFGRYLSEWLDGVQILDKGVVVGPTPEIVELARKLGK